MPPDQVVGVVSLFAGIGGIDLGLSRGDARLTPLLFCEVNEDAQAVLKAHFPSVPLHPDVRTLTSLPSSTRVLTAGSPCCDFSIANTAKLGMEGEKSSLLSEVVRLLGASPQIEHLVFENVANMLFLSHGVAMRHLTLHLDMLGFRWAYRVVDARAFGLKQRRRRLVLVASRHSLPTWLVSSSVPPEKGPTCEADASFASFSWVDGTRGSGFAFDSVPTIRAHDSSLFIASQPAVWRCGTDDVRLISAEDGEALQGLPVGWTACLPRKRRFARIGNSVPVPVFEWVGANLLRGGVKAVEGSEVEARGETLSKADTSHPSGVDLKRATEWPFAKEGDEMEWRATEPLSKRAIQGFLKRAKKYDKSGMPHEFMERLERMV